uniref:Uncharacterized protein ORF15 n=1 Tax=Metapseudomonas resinovorans TaxID=53412 RepID=Q9AQN0_METRE|nr:hypothetical protein [Pseudomonas resinovorans]
MGHNQPWRPTLADGTGQRLNPVATAHGPQTAIVVGADGQTTAGSGSPLHCDAMGRVRVRFHWQAEDDRGACWVRVGQALAGQGFGAQFLPRIGQEVLVHFINGDIDRPIIFKALYNGRGEGGVAPTPGGAPGQSNLAVYAKANDQRPSAEANLAGGNSPAWHGGGGGETQHRNAAALSGFKTQGFDGQGHNQLVFDDSDQQGRIQMATTQAHSQLNLGHLIHQAGNYRGSFRGQGFELRTDAYGAVRAAKGLLLSTYAIEPHTPAGDASAAQALLQQQRDLAARFDLAAQIHHTVPLASHRGVHQAQLSALIADQAPLQALHTSLSATVTGERLAQASAAAFKARQPPTPSPTAPTPCSPSAPATASPKSPANHCNGPPRKPSPWAAAPTPTCPPAKPCACTAAKPSPPWPASQQADGIGPGPDRQRRGGGHPGATERHPPQRPRRPERFILDRGSGTNGRGHHPAPGRGGRRQPDPGRRQHHLRLPGQHQGACRQTPVQRPQPFPVWLAPVSTIGVCGVPVKSGAQRRPLCAVAVMTPAFRPL